VDLALWLAHAEPESVTGRSDDNRASLLIKLADERGVAHIECVGNRPYRECVEARAAGRVIARYERGGLRQGARALLGAGVESPLVPSLTRQLESFARAVHGGSEPDLATAADGVRVMRIVEAALPARNA